MKQTSYKFFNKFIWIILVLLLSSTSCNMPENIGDPTAIIYPTAAIVETSAPQSIAPSATLLPTAIPPTITPTTAPVKTPVKMPIVKFRVGLTDSEVVVGDTAKIVIVAYSDVELAYVKLSLNSLDGEIIASDGYADHSLNLEDKHIGYTVSWKPTTPGTYTLYLIAYDVEKKVSDPATFSITVRSK